MQENGGKRRKKAENNAEKWWKITQKNGGIWDSKNAIN